MSSPVPHLADDQKQQATSPGTRQQQQQLERWPCANCHSMVSEDRCPFCHGIQVKIKNDDAVRNLSEAWIERVSPTTSRRSPPPLSRQQEQQKQQQPHDNNNNIDYDDDDEEISTTQDDVIMGNSSSEVVELDYDDEDETELEQTSDSSPRNDFQEDHVFGGGRPDNPVACLLATAESPLPKFEKRIEREEMPREDVKKASKDRVDDGASAAAVPGKKQRILFAM